MSGPFTFSCDKFPGLAKIQEESSELNIVLAKIVGAGGSTDHWSGDLRPNLVEELYHLRAAIDFFCVHNLSQRERARGHQEYDQKMRLYCQWREAGDKPPEKST